MFKNAAYPRLAAFLGVILAVAVIAWAEDDPTLGTWELNLAKSKFNPGPAFKSDTRIYEATPEGIKVRIKTVEADGKVVTSEYPANYDGKFYPVSGSGGGPADAVAMKKISDRVAESTLMHGNVVVAKARRVISEDGKTMTVTYKGSDPTGRQVDIVLVYDKQ